MQMEGIELRPLNRYAASFRAIVIAAFVPVTSAQAATYFYHTDHLGTPQVLTDANQAVVWQGDYDPFGKANETITTVEQNLRFPGQYLDRESGLHYNYFRTYDAVTGRYTQSDPIGLLFITKNPLTKEGLYSLDRIHDKSNTIPTVLNNLYGYSEQNPVVNNDELGLAPSSIQLVLPDISRRGDKDFTCLADDEDCEQEISACRILCRNAQFDGYSQEIWGGSYAQCMLGCVSWECMDYLPGF